MLASGARVAAAVSGGADSVCLLHALLELAPRWGARVTAVAHFNHRLRAEASDEDERFVAALAARLGLDFYRAEGSGARGNLEQAARRARIGFLSGLIREGAADRIAMGHTRDDQAETVLFRLMRGSGVSGLAGIHPVSPQGFVRPLIEVTRAEVEEFLRARGVGWREDASNREYRFARNRIRHGLLPQLAREWNPRIAEALAHLADLAQEEERWWKGEMDRLTPGLLTEAGGGVELNAIALAALPRAAARRVVRRAIGLAKGDLRRIEYAHVEGALELAASPAGRGRLRLPGVDAIRSFDWIRLAGPEAARPPGPLPVSVPGTYLAPDGVTKIRIEAGAERCISGCANLWMEKEWGQAPATMELRGWRPGDHYRPAGQNRDQKIKEMFHKARVPSWRRRFWPILSAGEKILWARGFGPAAEFAATEDGGWWLRIAESDAG